jgi:hypothetical protein
LQYAIYVKKCIASVFNGLRERLGDERGSKEKSPGFPGASITVLYRREEREKPAY